MRHTILRAAVCAFFAGAAMTASAANPFSDVESDSWAYEAVASLSDQNIVEGYPDGTFKGDKLLRKLKYVIFAVFVILLPLFLVDIMGQGAPYFCKLICPAGTLEGGLPLVLLNKSMRSALGWLYIWKNVILIITIILSILIYRPFCKYICPLGALYSIFNPVSLYKYRVDKDKCIKCGKCAKACQMIVDPVENSNSPECIRCGRCRKACPTDAIQCGIRRKSQS